MISKLWKAAALLALFVIALVLLTPFLTARLIDHDAVREKISDHISSQFDADLDFLEARLAVLPRPHLTIRQARLSRGNEFTARALAARLYPKLLPLVKGMFVPGRITLEAPEYILRLPEVSSSPGHAERPLELEDVHRRINRTLFLLQQLTSLGLPEMDLSIRGGRIKLVNAQKLRAGFELRHINGRYRRRDGRIEFDLDGMSNVFKEITARGWIDPDTFEGVAHADLAAFQPEAVVDYFYPDSNLRISNARLNVTLDIDADGKNSVRLNLASSLPQAQINRKGTAVTLRDQQIRAALVLENRRMEIHLADFTSAAPRLNLTGKFSIDGETDGVHLQLSGGEVDVAGLRAAAVLLAESNETVADVFEVLRSGSVPRIQVTAEGRGLRDLGSFKNYTIAGRMEAGNLLIPDLEFDLRNVSGEALITGGVLKGERLSAVLGNSSGTGGQLSLDLENNDFFQLGIDIQADLAQLPAVIHQFVEDKTLKTELGRIREVTGRATGHLDVDQKGNDTRLKVSAAAISMNASYDRFSSPLDVHRGRLEMNNDRMTLFDFGVTLGNTSATGISGRIGWEKALRLDLKATSLRLDVSELNNWLPKEMRSGRWAPLAADLSGTAEFKAFSVDYDNSVAPAAGLGVGGDIQRASVASTRLPGTLTVDGGKFRCNRDRLFLEQVTARLGKSRLNRADATLTLGGRSLLKASAPDAELDLAEMFSWIGELSGDRGGLAAWSAVSGKVRLNTVSLSGPANHPAAWKWNTDARLSQVRLQSQRLGAPIDIKNAELTAAAVGTGGTKIKLKPADISWGASHLTVAGNTGLSTGGIKLDLQLAADRLLWTQIDHFLTQAGRSEPSSEGVAITGTVSIQTDVFEYETLLWQPVHVNLAMGPRRIALDVVRAGLCGLDFAGRIEFTGERIDMHLVPTASGNPLKPAITCLSKDKILATGNFDLSGRLDARSKTADLRESVSGDLSLAATGGRIHHLGVLAKIFAILNVTEIYRGQLPDLGGDGFAYETMNVEADIDKSKLTMRQCSVEAPSMGLACEGDIDLAAGEMDLVILVAPFRTADRIVKHIPIVGGIMGGKLISIPFRAKGDIGDPTVIPLSPTAVGAGVLGLLERTLKLPINLFQPFFSGTDSGGASAESKE